jgi:SRSO17 transposase
MDLRKADGSESRFAAFVEGLASVIGHADRARPLFDYCVGLIMLGERKSVEPMAAAQHQSLLHFVGQSPWSDESVLAKVGEMVLPAIERHALIEAWIIDDTGFPKKGAHSVGVARQYCGSLANRITARSRCRCPLPITTPVCRRCIVSICRRIGR